MIIDMHAHLGDILNPGGGELIWKTGIRKKILYDAISHSERMLHICPPFMDKWLYRVLYSLVTAASGARNATATLENMQESLDESGVTHTVCLPIPPHLTFADLKRARNAEPRILPFTGVDYTSGSDIDAVLRKDVRQGAMGLKLHPIIQRVPLTDPRTLEAVEAFAVHGLPVLFHCGISSYYPKALRSAREDASFGEIRYARRLAEAFPGVRFIAGHAGLFKYRDVIELLAPCPNVMVDTSIHSPGRVGKLIAAFGPERVLFGSDWPYGNRVPALRILKMACKGDVSLERLVLYENAASVLGLDPLLGKMGGGVS